ncbi:SHOCT domain-containing protein [Microbacterium sp. Leaf159]|uniref:SHOCT domain-containing protein n=1 Tax=Microbacterium sp. Leaf159 TaxID=1736279 RepID=UPI0009E66FAD
MTEQLTKLASLRDEGILSDEEFAAKNAELLARLKAASRPAALDLHRSVKGVDLP